MYFTKVELHNFGIYRGHHEMCLSNRTGERNITLIGGLNGRGKTTFLDAILLALYGRQATRYIQESARSYERLLLEHINRHPTDDETYVAVSLRLDSGVTLRVRRGWRAMGKRAEESVLVEKDGAADAYLSESWSYYIEEILPFGIARFFFFDNEKITQLADDASFEQIKGSIRSAIGVSAIDRAIGHAEEVIRRKERDLEAFAQSDGARSYREMAEKLQAADAKLEEAREQLQALEEARGQAVRNREEKEQALRACGGDLARNREALQQQSLETRSRIAALREEMTGLLANPSTPLLLCRRLAAQVYDAQAETHEREAARLADDAVAQARVRVLRRFQESGLDLHTLATVIGIVNQEMERPIPAPDASEREGLSPTSALLLERVLGSVLPGLDQRAGTLIQTLDSLERTQSQLEARLAGQDVQDAAQLYRDLTQCEAAEALAKAELERQQTLHANLQRQREGLRAGCLRLIREMAEAESENDDNARVVRYAAMVIQVFKEFRLRLQREKVRRLSQTATECFQTLVEKDALIREIRIDTDTLDVTMLGGDGQEVLKSQLSAGEQQMFAISIVWALARTSGYQAPVVIDTPMARLDSSHRANFVTHYLPAASSQVLVLSTDEEIHGRYLDMIRDHVAAAFTLHYQDEQQCTVIAEGYFEEI